MQTINSIEEVTTHVKANDTLIRAVDISTGEDLINKANGILHTEYGNEKVTCTGQYGGATKNNKKKTQKKVKVQGKERVVYKGPRGGEYVKVGGVYKSLKSL